RPKPDGSFRPILNLKPVNALIFPRKFRLETTNDVKYLIRPNDFLTTTDLKDAYYGIPIRRSHRKFIAFQVNGKHYRFNRMPFGLSTAPYTFVKMLKPIVAELRLNGIRCLLYMDDLLILHQSYKQAEQQTQFARTLLHNLGFVISQKSSIVPSQEII